MTSRHRNHLPLLALLAILIMTAEAAAVSVLSCQGMTSCCCSMAAADMDMAAGTSPGCCADGASRTCDLDNTPAADLLYLTALVVDSVNPYAAATGRVVSTDIEAPAWRRVSRAVGPPGASGPPIYLQIQALLC